LFTEDATYSTRPYDKPYVGLPAIEAMWETHRDGPDEVFRLTRQIVAVQGDTAVARLEVWYGDPVTAQWRDLWVMRFAADGRCQAYEEWPVAPRKPRKAN
jgi:hypothetical protein